MKPSADKRISKPVFIEAVPILYHAQESREIPLPDGEASSLKVSPDGTRIVFVHKTAGIKSLSLIELPKGDVFRLDIGLDDYADPAWSNDGTQIVFAGQKKWQKVRPDRCAAH